MGGTDGEELDFVVDVTSFTKNGFRGTSKYEGRTVVLEFDEDGDGLFLSTEMARRINSRTGDSVTVIVEDGATVVTQLRVAAVGEKARFSDPKVYYAIGREGGAVVRVRRT